VVGGEYDSESRDLSNWRMGESANGNTKTTKRHESHETEDTPFVPFVPLRVIRVSNAPLLHYRNLLLRQPIQLIHQSVNLPVRGLDLPLVELLVGRDSGSGQLFVQL
jgi:hypothetical protein